MFSPDHLIFRTRCSAISFRGCDHMRTASPQAKVDTIRTASHIRSDSQMQQHWQQMRAGYGAGH
jgi:hypothetical protein